MILNNFNKIFGLLTFNNENEFYFLQVIKRRKDNPGLKQDSKIIKSFYIYSIEQLENKKDHIIELCKNNNARAYVSYNSRNSKEIALRCAIDMNNSVLFSTTNHANNIYDSVCGKYKSKFTTKLYMIDVDNLNYEVETINKLIQECNKSFQDSTIIHTPHGYHIITSPFNVQQFKALCIINNLDIDSVFTDGFTLLYYENN